MPYLQCLLLYLLLLASPLCRSNIALQIGRQAASTATRAMAKDRRRLERITSAKGEPSNFTRVFMGGRGCRVGGYSRGVKTRSVPVELAVTDAARGFVPAAISASSFT